MGAKPAPGPDVATLTPAPPAPPAGAGRRAWLLRGGGLLLLALLIGFLVRQGQLRPAQILDTLAHANPAWVALSVLLYFPFALIKSERWRLLAGDLGIGMGAGGPSARPSPARCWTGSSTWRGWRRWRCWAWWSSGRSTWAA
jgi:hypothetical protein